MFSENKSCFLVDISVSTDVSYKKFSLRMNYVSSLFSLYFCLRLAFTSLLLQRWYFTFIFLLLLL